MKRTALVTGAAAGIGRACARRLAKDGMAVGVLDIRMDDASKVADEIRAQGGQALALQASIADRSQVSAAVRQLRAAFGPVTVLVNNAGITDVTPFKEISEELWDRVITVNLKGTYIVTQVVLPDMEAARWGRIVNITSSSAQTGSPGQAHYSASKGAVVTLTRTLAAELGHLGITVNNIPPGTVMNTIMSEANRDRYGMSMEDITKNHSCGSHGRARRHCRRLRVVVRRRCQLRHRSDDWCEWWTSSVNLRQSFESGRGIGAADPPRSCGSDRFRIAGLQGQHCSG